MSYLCYLCLFVHSGVQHILRCVFVLFIRHVYPMLPVSLDFAFLIAHSQQIEKRNNLNVSCKLGHLCLRKENFGFHNNYIV
jgi:hypothetical protein